jgi:replication factor C subunit 3/5
MNTRTNIPLVEKWRPNSFDQIVLDPLNKIILKNIINTGYFPNLLFYGPPGTGKTTTIINLINSYQEVQENRINKSLVIHLNASDDRGVDIIRIQINQFVNSKSLFHNGMKFIILDEVDYMTKNAHQALRYLIQEYSTSVRFCLICNYISRIDEGLQNEFMKLKFNQLPKTIITDFLYNISTNENLGYDINTIQLIQQLYKSDIRNMINFMQSNQNNSDVMVLGKDIWEKIYLLIHNKSNINEINKFINSLTVEYNINKKNIIKDFINYIIRNKPEIVTTSFLLFVENLIHNTDCKISYYFNYAIYQLIDFL